MHFPKCGEDSVPPTMIVSVLSPTVTETMCPIQNYVEQNMMPAPRWHTYVRAVCANTDHTLPWQALSSHSLNRRA